MSEQMMDACRANARKDLASVRSIVDDVARRARAAGVSLPHPAIAAPRDGLEYLMAAMRSMDSLPAGDHRRRATVRAEGAPEFAALIHSRG
jgi:hypothetical protein